MPEGKNLEQQSPPEENLEAEKEKLFSEIESRLRKNPYSEESRYVFIRVLGHSFSDGLDLGKRLQKYYSGGDLLDFSVYNFPLDQRVKWLYIRQKKFFDELIKSQGESEGNARHRLGAFGHGFSNQYIKLIHRDEIFLEPETDLEKKVDAFYLKIFPHRLEDKHTREDLSLPEKRKFEKPETPLFQKAESVLERSKLFLSEHYYTGDFRREILVPALSDQLKTSGDDIKNFIENFYFSSSDKDIKIKLLYSSHISRKDVLRSLNIFGISGSTEIGKALDKIQYHGDIVDSRMIELAKKDLKKEVREKLPRGYVLEKDTVSGEWNIVPDPHHEVEKTSDLEEGPFFDLEKWKKSEFKVPDDVKDSFDLEVYARKNDFCLKLHGVDGETYLFDEGKLVESDGFQKLVTSRSLEGRIKLLEPIPKDSGSFEMMQISLEGGKTLEYRPQGSLITCESNRTKNCDSLYVCDWEIADGRVYLVEVNPKGEIKRTSLYEVTNSLEEFQDIFFTNEQTVVLILESDISQKILFYDIKNGKPNVIFTSDEYFSSEEIEGIGVLSRNRPHNRRKDFILRDANLSRDDIKIYEDVEDIVPIIEGNKGNHGYKFYQKGKLRLIDMTGKELTEDSSWDFFKHPPFPEPSRLFLGTGYNPKTKSHLSFVQEDIEKNEIEIFSSNEPKKTLKLPNDCYINFVASLNGDHLFECVNTKAERFLAVNEDRRYPHLEKVTFSDTEICLIFFNKDTGIMSMYRRQLPVQEEPQKTVGEYTPTDVDLRMLELLNAFESKEKALEYLKKYFSSNLTKQSFKEKFGRLFHQPHQKRTLEVAAKSNPEGFFGKMSVNFEPIKNPRRMVGKFLETFFPANSYPSSKYKRNFGDVKSSDYLNPHIQQEKLFEGDAKEKNSHIIFTSRRKVSGFYPITFLDAYNPLSQEWRKSRLTFFTQNGTSGTQQTYRLPVPEGLKEVILPVSYQGEFLSERIVGLKSNSQKEVPLSATRDAQGIWSVCPPKGVTTIIYSEISGSSRGEGISTNDDTRYRQGIISETANDLMVDIFDTLPRDWEQFLHSLHGKELEVQIEAVQDFVLSLSYYDFKNKETVSHKDNLTPSERVIFMKERLQALVKKEKNIDKKKKLQTKQLAGVCVDFTLVTVGLLRRLGIPAGITQGFLANDTDTLTTKNAHAVCFVPVPTQRRGEYLPRLIETTPVGLTDEEEQTLQSLRILSLRENREKHDQEMALLETQLKELQKIYDQERVLDILALQNGNLESILNTILKVGVKEHHIKIFENIFSLARYGGIDFSHSEILSDLAKKLIQEERSSLKEGEDGTAGTKLFHLFQEYIFRYTRDGSNQGHSAKKSRDQALATLEKIISVVSPHLEQIEKMAALVILADLKAQGMSSFAQKKIVE